MKYVEVGRKTFFSTIALIKYRENDIAEAEDFGCINIRNCYEKANRDFARYFVVYEGNDPIVTVMLQRDGHIIFFISKDVKHPIRLVRVLKRMAKKYSDCAGPIITKTAYWYKEAQRLNELIGFKPYKLYNKFGLYVYGHDYGVVDGR